ncbi:MAG: class I SAM-dependent methyltransferase [Candidatus Binatia bacterium]
MAADPSDHPFTPDLFERMDEGDDALFYAVPRRVVHLDDAALAAVTRFFRETLPRAGVILDLMSSWRSHLPADLAPKRVIGLGINAEEMAENPDLHEHVVHDLNREPRLPFGDEVFDAVVLTVSMQYLTRPIEVFRDTRRVLRPGAPFVVVISHRCFPQKAVKIWHQCQSMRERMELGMAYFRFAGGFTGLLGVDLRPGAPPGADPVLAILASREGSGETAERPTSGWRRR